MLRGPGYFTVDTVVRKTFDITERQHLDFSWEVFNVTNSVRFNIFSALPEIDISGSFGKFTHTLNGPRVMEFMRIFKPKMRRGQLPPAPSFGAVFSRNRQ